MKIHAEEVFFRRNKHPNKKNYQVQNLKTNREQDFLGIRNISKNNGNIAKKAVKR